MGFFKPKTTTPALDLNKGTDDVAEGPSPRAIPTTSREDSSAPTNSESNNKPIVDEIEEWETWPSNDDPDKEVFDPIKSKESWSKLLGKRVPPKCEHDEACITLVTKKPGVNCGKWPYLSIPCR